jgi:hypothetical protein
MLQIVFNEISAAEMSQMDTLAQLEVLTEFTVTPEGLEKGGRFGRVEREQGMTLYRYRAKDWRIYFAVIEGQVIVHRVLHKNTLEDFLYRSNLPGSGEDEALAKSKHFWRMIEEGERAARRP